MKIAVIGAGIMGTGVGLTLLGKGHEVFSYNRTKENAADLIKGGAVFCTTPRQAAENASHVIILVWNEAALSSVLEGEDGLYACAKKGQVFIDMSTQLPETARREGNEFKKRGALFLDAPVHGTKAEANSGGLWIMAGAEKDAWEAALPVLSEIGATFHYMGDVGSGCIAKLCGNHLVSAIIASLAESLAMGKKAGIDCYELLKLWGESSNRRLSTGQGVPCWITILPSRFTSELWSRTRNLSGTIPKPLGFRSCYPTSCMN
jgi:3-hydroxyisobutyrate dehydrogenase